jgi:uncharacterized protein (TIGR01777 family)
MEKNILITGGTGLIGTRLAEKLKEKGYTVSFLSRQSSEGKIKKYRWDLKTKFVDEAALKTADCIIHLAGAGVFDKRWSAKYRKEIIDSRIDSTALLYEKLSSAPNTLKSFISASAIGIYGYDTGSEWQTENTPAGEGFLAEVTKNWEASVLPIQNLGIRTAIIRLGIVLSDKGGSLRELLKPINYFIGSPMGEGNQYISWIHIDDLCALFIYALENETLTGVYNAVAPEPVTNEILTKEIALQVKKPLWLPNLPVFVLKLILGAEKSMILLGGNRVSSKKITDAGFKFNYTTLKPALENLLKGNK